MIKINNIYAKLVATVVTVITLAGCGSDPSLTVYLKNSTSQPIVFRAISNEIPDSLAIFHKYESNVYGKLDTGMSAILYKEKDLYYNFKKDLNNNMRLRYPFGIVIKFENGDSIVYYQSKAETDFHSPYNADSYFQIEKSDSEFIAEYDVLY